MAYSRAAEHGLDTSGSSSSWRLSMVGPRQVSRAGCADPPRLRETDTAGNSSMRSPEAGRVSCGARVRVGELGTGGGEAFEDTGTAPVAGHVEDRLRSPAGPVGFAAQEAGSREAGGGL
ncbi:hypothetical protein ADL21_09525 [Streptomyces albus subsp. albus]|nr:hypothetical protein ADL21_09525 [Streptomyces albus subsp. albus]